MARSTSRLLVALLALVVTSAAVAGVVTRKFTYQGRLIQGGVPASGKYDMLFKLYDDAGGLIDQYPAAGPIAVPVAEGLFTVEIDFSARNAFDGNRRFLEIIVEGTPLTPLQELTATPHATYAITSDTLDGRDSLFFRDASNLNTGTLADARLSNNVALLTGAQTFTGLKTFSANPGFAINNNTKINNLNADLLDGIDSTGFLTGIPNPLSITGSHSGNCTIKGVNTSSGSGSAGVCGEATSSGGNLNYGVKGIAAGMNGRGVYGEATGDEDDGFTAGVYGVASNTAGFSYGIRGSSSSVKGRGCLAEATSATGTTYGIWALVSSPDGTAGRFQNYSGGLGLRVDGTSEFYGAIKTGDNGAFDFYDDNGTKTVEIRGAETVSTGGQIRLAKADGTYTIEIDADFNGDGRIITNEIQITGGSDLSEGFDITAADGVVEAGRVVCIDPNNVGKLLVSTQAYDRTVAGVISGAGGVKPGMMMGQRDTKADGHHPVALTGRVYVWCDASFGAIQPGDMLTTSTTAGHAMKVADYEKAHGAVIGKAMSALPEGRGLVLVLVNLQ